MTGKVRLINFDCAIRFAVHPLALGLARFRSRMGDDDGGEETENAEGQVRRGWIEREDREVRGMLNDPLGWE